MVWRRSDGAAGAGNAWDTGRTRRMTDDLLSKDRRTREAFRRGERWAMELVFQTYMPLVRTVAIHGFSGFRGFRNPADQDDTVQQVFCAAFEERARLSYDGLKPYSAFLRGIAHNVVRQHLSKHARFQRTDGAPVPEDRMADDLEGCVIDSEEQALMRRFRESVTDPTEQAVLTGYFCDGTAEETLASDLRITRYRLRKTIAALHKRMCRYLRDHDVLDA